jgi:hypothetical protein
MVTLQTIKGKIGFGNNGGKCGVGNKKLDKKQEAFVLFVSLLLYAAFCYKLLQHVLQYQVL